MCSPRIYFYRLVIWEWLMLNVQKGQLEIDLKVQKVQKASNYENTNYENTNYENTKL